MAGLYRLIQFPISVASSMSVAKGYPTNVGVYILVL